MRNQSTDAPIPADTSPAPTLWRRSGFWIHPLLFAGLFWIFLASPVSQMADSRYSLVLSENLLRGGGFQLDRHFVRPLDPAKYPSIAWEGYPYQIQSVGGHAYYYFPPGGSILSVPMVALLHAVGLSAVDAAGIYDLEAEYRMQCIIAAGLMAAMACLVFSIARGFLGWKMSLIVALGTALGTPVWSTASRALWSDTWGIFLATASIRLLMEIERRPRAWKAALLGTLLAGMYVVKPTYSIPVVSIMGAVWCQSRRSFAPCALTALVGFLLFVFYSWTHFGQILPAYYQANRLSLATFWTGLAGNLVSPARGLFVYIPVVIIGAFALVRRRRRLPSAWLAGLALVNICGHIAIIAAFPVWWGGYSYGPRLLTAIVPWFALVAAVTLGAGPDGENVKASPRRRSRWSAAVATALLAAGIWIHWRGASSWATWDWNSKVNIEEHHERLWDWSHPQFLAGLISD